MLQDIVRWTANAETAVYSLPWDKVGATILLVIVFGLFMKDETPSK